MALEVSKYLNEIGVQTELHIVGYTPEFTVPNFVKVHGYVSKESEEGKHKINTLLKESHFLILPSIADCTPVVFSEANSFGVPCISTNVGGIGSIIKNDINGQLFQLGAAPNKYGDYIKKVFGNDEKYKELAFSSFNYYLKYLNWDKVGAKLKNYLEEII